MRSYLTLFSLSLLFSLGLTPIVRRWAVNWGALDVPNDDRRIHKHPIPRLGGLAIYLAFLATLALAPWLGTLVSQNLLSSWRNVGVLLAAGTLIFALGVYDDFRGANATVKVLVQLIAAAALYFFGFRINGLSLPFGGFWELPMLLGFPLTALWIVGITNAFNLIDGIDGLAAGASAFALLSLFLCSLAQVHPEVSLMSIILVGAVIGFLRYNFNPAKIFLGDSGSLMLGFMAAALSLVSAQKSSTLIAVAIPLISFGLPVTEVGVSLSRRFLSGAPLLQGDRRHIHHMLLQRGLTQRQAVILLYGACALFTLFGLMLLHPQRNKVALILFVLGVGIGLGVYQLRYPEFHALGASLKRSLARRKHSLADDARWLGSLESIRMAGTLDDLLASLDGICHLHGFAAARLELPEYDPSVLSKLKRSELRVRGLELSSNGLDWRWPRAETFRPEHGLTWNCWSIRLPLIAANGQNLGAFTLYQSLAGEMNTMPADSQAALLLLGRELSAALDGLCAASDGAGHLQPVGTYRQNYERTRAQAAS